MAFNPDPYYRDPELEKLKVSDPDSTQAIDRFNAPPPGHSLTDTPGDAAWERPPVYTDPEEAMGYIVERVEKPEVEENFLRLLLAGTPIEAIANTVVFSGFQEGYWTPDISELLKPAVALHFVGLALENSIPATMYNVDPEVTKENNRVSEEDVLSLMEQRRPDMFNKLMYAADLLLEDIEEAPEEDMEGGMMAVEQQEAPPSEGFMTMEEEELV